MRRFVSRIAVILALICSATPGWAQAKKGPDVTVLHAGVNRLYAGLEYIYKDLANEPKQFETLKDTLDVYFVGVDGGKSALLQLFVRSGKFKTALHTPVAKAGEFRGNLKALGVKSAPLGGGLFQVTGLFKGFLKEFPGITVIAEERADVVNATGALATVAKGVDLVENDVVALIKNDDKIADRREAIQDLKDQVVAGLKQLKNETPDEFALRKQTLIQQFAEIEQVYAEAETITSRGKIDIKGKRLVSHTELTTLKGSGLATTVAKLGTVPSAFGAWQLPAGVPFRGQLCYPLDELRQKHVGEFATLARTVVQQSLTEASTRSPEARKYLQHSVDIFFDILAHQAESGMIDARSVVTKNESGTHTLVGAVKAPGTLLLTGLEKIKAVTEVKLATKKVGKIDIHTVAIPKDMSDLHGLFGKELVMVLGTGEDAVWYALGEKADEALSAAIEQAESGKAPSTPEPVIHAQGRANTGTELLDAVMSERQRGKPENRQMALDAFKPGDDTFEFRMERAEGTLKLFLQLDAGILRYFGKSGAKFVKENL